MKFKKLDVDKSPTCLLIVDWIDYVRKEESIKAWANECTPGWYRQGLLLVFKHKSELSSFMLRWT